MERRTNKEKVRFLDITKASAGELRTQIYIGIEIEYIDNKTGKYWIDETREISAMLMGLIRSLKSNN